MEDTLHGTYLVRKISGDESSIILSDVEISVIGEISLKIYINGIEYASLLCLNQLTEELALGFLYSEGIIDTIDDVASISYNERLFAVMINLVAGKTIEKCESLRSVTSGCGKCFTYINPLKQDKFIVLSGNNQFSLLAIMEAMKDFERRSEIHKNVGGVHSVLLQHNNFSVFNEDIGRHNCFDKIAGVLLRNRKMNLIGGGMLFVSGRVSSEIITKVIRMGAPVIVSRSTPTSAAVNLARQYKVTLLGYVRENSGYIYSGEERLI
ncbi:MAG TPA: formate dehydrogenase accessory sulfurtransferase FdhD [Smithellaceae bacterium]|jgi:FdhD protein|nr:formate dehydrogenase accessory sulfurtransferase FdhD [Smithellaceae bacterium]HPN87380.1 formate dehydrogenase accessory sulfurtransferase FdhD [Smithella sp.]